MKLLYVEVVLLDGDMEFLYLIHLCGGLHELYYPNSTVYAIDKNTKVLKVVADKIKKANIDNVNLSHSDGSFTIAHPNDYADI